MNPPPKPSRTLHTIPFCGADSVLYNLRIRVDESPPYVTYELDFLNSAQEQVAVPKGVEIECFSRDIFEFSEQRILPFIRVYVCRIEDGVRITHNGKLLFWKAPGDEL